MLVFSLIFLVSLAGLIYSADKLIDFIVDMAELLGIPIMVIGLTVVAIGTSLPEAAASVVAALDGHPEIAIGNVVGSNICNVSLILGFPALFATICCKQSVLKREGILMLLCSTFLLVLGFFLEAVPSWLGIVMLVGFFVYIWSVFAASKSEKSGVLPVPDGNQSPAWPLLVKVLLSLIGLLVSSRFLVDSTVSLAQTWGIPEHIIALSLIALGTSLPELSVSLASARKGEGDILVGNILGSNISNILLVVGLASAVEPVPLGGMVSKLDTPIMFALALMMFYFLWGERGLDRRRGLMLLGIYVFMVYRFIALPA